VYVLETERLRLRKVTAEDADFLLELLNEPGFIRYVADRGLRTTADAERYIAEKITPSYAQNGFGFYVVELKTTKTPVGMCGLIKRETLEDVDIGYSYFERFWGQGYATEAGAAVMDYGRRVFSLARIVGITAPDNLSSIKVLERLGLRFERMIQLPGTEAESKLFS
jgi:RimJ/RimL family protein N-acetyltransferase